MYRSRQDLFLLLLLLITRLVVTLLVCGEFFWSLFVLLYPRNTAGRQAGREGGRQRHDLMDVFLEQLAGSQRALAWIVQTGCCQEPGPGSAALRAPYVRPTPPDYSRFN